MELPRGSATELRSQRSPVAGQPAGRFSPANGPLFGSGFFLCTAGRATKIDLERSGAIDQHARFPFARAEMVHAPGHEPIGACSHLAQGRGIIGVASTECKRAPEHDDVFVAGMPVRRHPVSVRAAQLNGVRLAVLRRGTLENRILRARAHHTDRCSGISTYSSCKAEFAIATQFSRKAMHQLPSRVNLRAAWPGLGA